MACVINSAIFGEGGDHAVPGHGVAGGHGFEELDSFVDAAATSKLSELKVLGKDEILDLTSRF